MRRSALIVAAGGALLAAGNTGRAALGFGPDILPRAETTPTGERWTAWFQAQGTTGSRSL